MASQKKTQAKSSAPIESQEMEHSVYKTDSDFDDEEDCPPPQLTRSKTRKISPGKKEMLPKPKRMKALVAEENIVSALSESSPLMADIEQTDTNNEKRNTMEELYQQQFEQKQVKQKDEITNNLIASTLCWLSKNTQSEGFRIVFKDFLPYLQIGSFEYDRITTTFRPCRTTPWGSSNTQFKSVAEIPLGDSHVFDLFKGKFQTQFTAALIEAEEKKKEYENKLITQQQRYQQSRFGYKSNSFV